MVHITACFLFQILEQIEYGEQFPEDLVYRSFEMFLRIFEFFSDRYILWAVFLTFAAVDSHHYLLFCFFFICLLCIS